MLHQVDHANYIYGHERRFEQYASGAQTWYHSDALGSMRQTADERGAILANTWYDPWGGYTGQGWGSIATFGFTGELQDENLTYLRARWYDTDDARFMSRDPFAGFPETPYSLHPYQYAYSNPALWTDPTGECVGWIWGDPTCQFIGWDRIRRGDLNYADATPWAGAGVDFTPGIGDLKGLIEVYTGCDIVTGEALGWWRWTGLIFLSELRQLRRLGYLDDFTDIGKFGEDVPLPPGARASGGGGGSSGGGGRGSGRLPTPSWLGKLRRGSDGFLRPDKLLRANDKNHAEQLAGQYTGVTPSKLSDKIPVPGTRRNVVPDLVGQDFLGEVKFITKQLSTKGQQKDTAIVAGVRGVPYYIFTTEGTRIQKGLKKLIEETGGEIIYLFEHP
jgi:RHS repeat-associated protein